VGTPQVLAAKHATSVIPSFCDGGGPGRQRPCHQSVATWRQRHRPVPPVERSCWQAARTLARGCSKSPAIGDLSPICSNLSFQYTQPSGLVTVM
jgi:hypothetical protein